MKLKKLFTNDECNKIIDFLENKNEWEHIHRLDPDGDLYAEYYINKFVNDDIVINSFKKYIKSEFLFDVNIVNVYALKYLPNCKFGRHFDRQFNYEFNKDFVYNINVTLNDNFEGGEFWLDDKLFEGNEPGIVYYYNSTQWHEVKPIKNGVRYSMLCYIRERDFIKKQTKSLL